MLGRVIAEVAATAEVSPSRKLATVLTAARVAGRERQSGRVTLNRLMSLGTPMKKQTYAGTPLRLFLPPVHDANATLEQLQAWHCESRRKRVLNSPLTQM